MALTHLHARCPVLPVDADISLARYLARVEETHATAASCEASDKERAALLHIRIAQLVTKTLPAHPDASLPASEDVVAKLHVAAHASFDALDRLEELLSGGAAGSAGANVQVPTALPAVFCKVGTAIGVLAGRQGRVTALVIPAQDGGRLKHVADVQDLARHKKIELFGLVTGAPLDEGAARDAQLLTGDAALVVVAVAGEQPLAWDLAPGAEPSHAKQSAFVSDGEPGFKLYDLRSLGAARDKQSAQP